MEQYNSASPQDLESKFRSKQDLCTRLKTDYVYCISY